MRAHVRLFSVVAGERGDGATGRLEQERYDIAGNEGQCVGLGAEAGEVSTVDVDDAGQAKIDRGGEEGGADC